MGDLLQSVRVFVRRYGLLSRGDAVVMGVSGGPDSLCLLHVLQRMSAELGLRLWVAHFNHGLRGAESDADARFVAQTATDWGLTCTVGTGDVSALAREQHLSIEEAARQARYRFLAATARAVGANKVAVAHHADDQAETVLMHFLRGSGPAGLRGMLPLSALDDDGLASDPGTWAGQAPMPSAASSAGTRLSLIRPLLGTTRAEIEAYCAQHGLTPRFDLSNADTTIFRNRLRHELLPLLETYNPRIRRVLAHTGEVLAGDCELLQAQVAQAWERLTQPSSARGQPDAVQFDLKIWRGLPLGLQRATIREAIRCLRRSLRNINWDHVERAVWLAREGQTGARATLAGGLELRIGYGMLHIAPEGAVWLGEVPQVVGECRLNAPGVTDIGGGWRAVVRLLTRNELPLGLVTGYGDRWTAFLDAHAVGPELTLRSRRPGDRFCPYGLRGHSALLAEFMINAKVPSDVRDAWPLLVGRPGIVWVCGLRVDERAAVRDQTTHVWQVQLGQGASTAADLT